MQRSRKKGRPQIPLYDVFICHASEDKEEFVRPLAEILKSSNIEVWYDEFALKLGDSIRRCIDAGLRQSRFGVIVLSKAFFAKKWPQYELDGLAQIEMQGNDKVILPVWHKINYSDVMLYSPSLANRKAVNSTAGIDKVASAIFDVVHPDNSPLIVARDFLISKKLTPPVITDAWWLHIAEFASGYYNDYLRWTFPIPYGRNTNKEWGESLAWSALQETWADEADDQEITTISHPNDVLKFIRSSPGLKEICFQHIEILAKWAPQLIIPGFGQEFEPAFQEKYEISCKTYPKNNSQYACSRMWSFRHPTFGNHEPRRISHKYFNGSMVSASPYSDVDHVFWLISDDSAWLPDRIRKFLIEGFKSWFTWTWGFPSPSRDLVERKDQWNTYGNFFASLYEEIMGKNSFHFTPNVIDDIRKRIEYSKRFIHFKNSVDEILNRFITEKFAESFIVVEKKERSNNS